MPILNKKKQSKAEAKRAPNPQPLPQPEIVSTQIIEQPCGPECHCCSASYTVPAEPAEQAAKRLARYAAEGRNASGVLISAEPRPSTPLPYKWEGGLWLQRAKPHSAAECQAIVDLFGPQHGADLILYDNEGWSFDDLYGAEMETALADWCKARRSVEAEIKAAEDARIAALWQKCVIEQAVIEARRNLKRGEKVQKNGRLCTRLYSCVGTKQTGGAKPTTKHVSSECFTHREFLAGRIKDDCPFAHPGDATWHIQWATDRFWKPVDEPVRTARGPQRFAPLAPSVPRPTSESQSWRQSVVPAVQEGWNEDMRPGWGETYY